jgi:Zn-dependent protease
VASAGVLTNLALAIVAGIAFKVFMMQGLLTETLAQNIFTVIAVNLSLFLFNLIPIPPFDGMAIIQSLFPRLRISSAFIYNPIYLILAIVVASTIFSALAPVLFSLVKDILLF